MSAHVRVQVDRGQIGWSPQTAAARVSIHDRASNGLLDEFLLPVSESGHIDVPIEGVNDPVVVSIKVATYLSETVEIEPRDGLRIGPITLVNGDVNGDDCVDDIDLLIVTADLGAGGEFARVPPSDLNRDGVVDDLDVAVVRANLGVCDVVDLVDSAVQFVRGDADSNGQIDCTDVIGILSHVFFGDAPPACSDAADADDNGMIEPSDAILVLSWLYSEGEPPRAPTPDGPTYSEDACGVDSSVDSLGCLTPPMECQ